VLLCLTTSGCDVSTSNRGSGPDAGVPSNVVPADAVVNVRTVFGATGDGITDDTTAIQTAILILSRVRELGARCSTSRLAPIW